MRRTAALATLLLLAGCGGSIAVDDYPTEPGTDIDCQAMFADIPPTIDGQDARSVPGDVAAAWGDPPIVLRCGVEKPAGLTASSACFPVRGIGWFAEKTADGYLFTSIGRRYYVSVDVPSDYEPEADALADLADTIGRHDPEVRPCA